MGSCDKPDKALGRGLRYHRHGETPHLRGCALKKGRQTSGRSKTPFPFSFSFSKVDLFKVPYEIYKDLSRDRFRSPFRRRSRAG